MDETRAYPHDLTAERALLGAVMVDNGLYAVAAGVVQAGDFYRDAHARIWAAYGRLDAKAAALDIVTLRDALMESGDLERAGGMAELAGLTDGVPKAVNVEAYARIVRDKARLRALIAAARATIDDAFAGEETPADVIGRAESRLLGLDRGAGAGSFVFAAEWMSSTLRTIEARASARQAVSGVPTGIPSLDRMTRGFQPSNFIIIAARTGVGKTSLAVQVALEASRHAMAAYFSFEMSAEELGFRAVANESNVDAFRQQTGYINAEEAAAVGMAASRLGERRLAITDAPLNIQALCSEARRLKATHELGIIFVDYIGLIEGPRSENRVQEVSAISRRLKALAMELQIPVVGLAQLSREAAKGNDRPQLHHLRESGALEQDANVVLLLHRPQAKDDASGRYSDGEPAELWVAKNRNGPCGKVDLQWRAALTKFIEQVDDDRSGPYQERLA